MKNQRKKKRIIFVGSIFAISILALVFMILNFREQIVFFYSPTELKQLKNFEKQIRVGGLVVEKTIIKTDALTTEFIITDLTENLRVGYTGLLPNLFREKQGVVAKGKFDEQQNKFFASELLVKHDEKYMPPEVARVLKK
jgi:cytochrome c-type biogenesis protein CcmE